MPLELQEVLEIYVPLQLLVEKPIQVETYLVKQEIDNA